jgi:hypothetical protein
MRLTPLAEWACDECGDIIRDPAHGWLEWVYDTRPHAFRIVHHAPHSPDYPERTCQRFTTEQPTYGDRLDTSSARTGSPPCFASCASTRTPRSGPRSRSACTCPTTRRSGRASGTRSARRAAAPPTRRPGRRPPRSPPGTPRSGPRDGVREAHAPTEHVTVVAARNP